MVVTETILNTQQWLKALHRVGKSTGFVPTMGALHDGHLELVKRAVKENNAATCSIFVNPIQFNNPEDLEKYPRTLDADLKMLEKTGCSLVFVPSIEEMYPEPVHHQFDFSPLDQVMEGRHRPGHFNGVAIVVKKLFEIMSPRRAYFGEKDFQQLRIIQELVKLEKILVEIIPCPTVREPDGLAMSSRNRRLTVAEREVAPEIFQTLLFIKENAQGMAPVELVNIAAKRLENMGMKVDYIEIADPETLRPVNDWASAASARAFIACFLGDVRLIDNMILFSNFAPL